MIYAPVIIPTLCRVEKLKKCIQSLQRNSYAKYTELYISLDYPPKEKYREGYLEVKKYLDQGIDGFADVIILEQESNKGWYWNFQLLRQKVFEKYNCYIGSEDDNEFSPNFLEYMDRCLTEYEHDETILAVSGYSYPVDWQVGDCNVLKVQSYFAGWGYGIWRNKEEKAMQMLTVEQFEKKLRSLKYMHKLYHTSHNQYCNFIKGMIGYTDMLVEDGLITGEDLAFGLYQIFEDKYMVFPSVSKVRNTGYGEDSVHCKKADSVVKSRINHRNYPYHEQPIDRERNFGKIVMASDIDQDKRIAIMEEFFTVSVKECLLSIIAQIGYTLFGKRILVKLVKRVQGKL